MPIQALPCTPSTEPVRFDRLAVGGDHRGRGPVALDDQLVNVGGVQSVHRLQGKIVQDQQVHPDELSDLGVVAVVEARGPQAFQQHVGAAEGDAVAPTDGGVAQGRSHKRLAHPDGPKTKALWPASIKRSEHSSSQTWWSKLTLVEASQFSRHMSGSRPAALARSDAEVVSRLVTSSDRTSSKKSAWAMSALLARANRSGKVSRQRPSFTWRSTALSSAVMTGAGAVIAPSPGGRGWRDGKRPLRWLLRPDRGRRW